MDSLRSYHSTDKKKENPTYVASITCVLCREDWHLYDSETLPVDNSRVPVGVPLATLATPVAVRETPDENPVLLGVKE